MTQQIKLKRNTTNTTAPETGDIDVGELAISAVDGKIYLRKTDNLCIHKGHIQYQYNLYGAKIFRLQH